MSIVREWRVSFFTDSSLSDEIQKVDFGEVWENTEREITIYIKNEEEVLIRDLQYTADDIYVKIDGPKTLGIGAVKPMVITWEPSVESLALRDDITITGTAVYR